MQLWSRLCNLVPAIIVENILWSTLFLVGVLNVLTWIVFSSYLVSDILLFAMFVWKVVEWVFCLVLLLFCTADIMLIGKLFWYFSSSFLVQGEKEKKEDIYINNYNNYNCNKQKPQTINVGVQCWVSAVWTNLPVARKSKSHPPPRHIASSGDGGYLRYAEPATGVVSMLYHRQSSVNVDHDIFDMTFEGNVMIANSQMVIVTRWHFYEITMGPTPKTVSGYACALTRKITTWSKNNLKGTTVVARKSN